MNNTSYKFDLFKYWKSFLHNKALFLNIIICWVVWFTGVHSQSYFCFTVRNLYTVLFPETILVHWMHTQEEKCSDANLKVSCTAYWPWPDGHMTTPGFVVSWRVFARDGRLGGVTPRKWILKVVHSPRVICRTCLRSLGSPKRIVLPSMKFFLTVSRYFSGKLSLVN